MILSGKRNLITDVEGILVGNAQNEQLKSGSTALICNQAFTASVQVLGGAPGTRDTELLEPHNSVQGVDALVLSGGSAFGLDAGSGVQNWLRNQGRGFEVGPVRVPIVPSAILFDLINGGDKNWVGNSPYSDLGFQAAENASADFNLGSHGAGIGALTANLKGGLGSASTVLDTYGVTIGALVAVNALGSTTIGDTHHFWASPFEVEDEFGRFGLPSPLPDNAKELRTKFGNQNTSPDGANTTIGIIATDAKLTKAECKRLAIAAHDGFTRAIWPSHTPMDGDLVFSVSTGSVDLNGSLEAMIEICAMAGSTMARAVARGIYMAQEQQGDIMPVWSSLR